MNDFLDQKRNEIVRRVAQLAPAVEEYRRLQAAAQALDRLSGSPVSTNSTNSQTTPRPRGRPRRASAVGARKPVATATRARSGGGRPKGSGRRATQAVRLVKRHPGVTIGELATKMGIKSNYLYRVLPSLEKEGKLAKQGRGWYPA